MEISALTCSHSKEQPKKLEPELEFYLEEGAYTVTLKVRDKANGVEICGNVLSVYKDNGKIARHSHINKAFGLPLTASLN